MASLVAAPIQPQRRKRALTPGKVVQVVILCALPILSAVPIVMMISMSLRPTTQIYTNFFGLPWPLYFNNYTSALVKLILPLLRTLLVYGLSIVVMLSLASGASYAFARIQFPGRAKLFYMIILVMMIPGTILLTPHFILANQLGLRDNLLGLVVFYVAGGQPFAIFLLSSYFQS